MLGSIGEALVNLTDAEKLELLGLLEAQEYDTRYNRLARYKPYAKQREFHELISRERLLIAANQAGKTYSGAAECAMHLTGRYPEGWKGIRFNKPITMWVGSVTRETTRDAAQRLLLGRDPDYGSGLVPLDCIDTIDKAQGIPGTVARAIVKHVSGGISFILFKSYDQGREKWQGDSVDFIWFDEEPPPDIYSEGLTRTNATDGKIMMTFTPLLGMSEVVQRFLLEKRSGTAYVNMTIDDAEHYTPEKRAEIIASYSPHEVEARTRGIPALGSGRVFPVTEAEIMVESFNVPTHWPVIGGLDFGFDHPAAAVKVAWDRDNDCMYVINAFRQREATPAIHAAALRPWGNIPWSWPHDGLQHDKGSGIQLAEQYRMAGLNLLPERATFPDGSNGLEAGVIQMLQRMQTGRLKVFSHLNEWFEEFRLYHREKGLIVKVKDDLLSATRYAMMMLRYAGLPEQPVAINYDDKWVV